MWSRASRSAWLLQIERFALGNAFQDIDEYYVGKFFGGDPVGGGGADVTGSYYGNFLAHGWSSWWAPSWSTGMVMLNLWLQG